MLARHLLVTRRVPVALAEFHAPVVRLGHDTRGWRVLAKFHNLIFHYHGWVFFLPLKVYVFHGAVSLSYWFESNFTTRLESRPIPTQLKSSFLPIEFFYVFQFPDTILLHRWSFEPTLVVNHVTNLLYAVPHVPFDLGFRCEDQLTPFMLGGFMVEVSTCILCHDGAPQV
jgi:hypothetical protein